MTPKVNLHERDEYVEFIVCSSIYTDPDKNGKQKLIKKDLLTKISLYLDDIQAHEHVIDKSGKILKSYCRIYHINMGPVVIKASYNDISQLKATQHTEPQSTQVGFKHSTKKHNGKSK